MWILYGCTPYVLLSIRNSSISNCPFHPIARSALGSCAQMLAAIGETFDPHLMDPELAETHPESLVTGVIVSSRPQFYRISIWTRSAPGTNTDEDDKLRQRIEGIGKHFKTSVLGYSEGQKLAGPLATEVEFISHKDSEKKGKGRKIIV